MRKIYHTEEARREAQRAYDRSRTVSYERPQPRPNPRNAPRPATREGYRVCNDCGEKPLAEFHYRNGKPLAICIACERARDRERSRLRRIRKTPEKPKATRLGHKVCNTCLQEKPYSAFMHDSAQKDGYAGRCSQCKSERYQADEEAKAVKKAYNDAYREANHEALTTYDRTRSVTDERRTWRKERDAERKVTDPTYVAMKRESMNRWREANPLVVRENSHRTKIRRKEAIATTVTERVSYKAILERDGNICYICQQAIDFSLKEGPGKLHFDHVIPLRPRKGEPRGTHTASNIRPAHTVCNLRKNNRRFEDLTDFDKRGVDY